MRAFKYTVTAVAAMAWANTADAQTITLADPQMIAELLGVEGYEAKLDPSKPDEDPYIAVTREGAKFGVYFSNCEKGKRCQSLQYYMGFTNHKLNSEKINLWNSEKRFVCAFLDKEGDAVLMMDVNVEPGGMDRKLFVDNLEIWWSLTYDFEERAYPKEEKKPG